MTTPTQQHEVASYTSTTDYTEMSKAEQARANYILKEQMNRQKMMERDNNKVVNPLEMGYPQSGLPSLSIQSSGTMTEFREDEWTPQDSSYGAAFPCCGWIPKRIRQAIERVLIALVGLLIIYTVVSIAILLTGDHKSQKSNASDYNYMDNLYDDLYVKDTNTYYDDDSDDYVR